MGQIFSPIQMTEQTRSLITAYTQDKRLGIFLQISFSIFSFPRFGYKVYLINTAIPLT